MARRKTNPGGPFERRIATELSLWWTGGSRDDVFWRSHGSGGRATRRAGRGKTTAGHCGDIASTDPCSKAFTDKITLELKKNYNRTTLADFMDRPKTLVQQELEAFVEQAATAAKTVGTPYWAVVHGRFKRVPVVYMPHRLWNDLGGWGDRFGLKYEYPVALVFVNVRMGSGRRKAMKVAAVTWPAFLAGTTPDDIRAL